MGLDAWTHDWAKSDRIAFVFEEETLSYAQFGERVSSCAVGLADVGVGHGDRVGFCGLNRVELFATFFACARLGAILMPLNNRLTPVELAWQIEHSSPTVVLIADGFHGVIADAVQAASAGNIQLRDLDANPFPLLKGKAKSGEPAVGKTDDDVLMVYTSGTTGQPKGALLTQDAIIHTALNSIACQAIGPEDVILTCIPTFHVGGLNIQTLPALSMQARVVLHRRFVPELVLEDIVRLGVTQTVLVPPMLDAVAALPSFADADLGSLTSITTGSSVVSEACMAPYFDRDIPVLQVYGSTETGPTAIASSVEDVEDQPTSCGRVAVHTEARVVRRNSDKDARPGFEGEIWVKGANLFNRYWNDEQASAEALVDGWFRTGDVGRRDADGYFWITDRLSDMIITGGENVYPAEVEGVLSEHPGVASIAVIGTPDDRWGEAVTAVVVPDEHELIDLESLRAFGSGSLARYKLPRRLKLRESLPLTALGKVQKHLLRDELA